MAVTKEEFERYKRVQKSGICNMLSPKVQEYANITKAVHIEIIQNYDELSRQYGGIDYEND